ncbi:unnamed protein product [Arabis nemorensis]|uniref:DUF4283 domain-containing protein n=1 Tax=Arabis nemorensis TaxID=586526 RepID=A0A565CUE4_9BRAS|nr:unnamed protein product [Arabis nemorensis]
MGFACISIKGYDQILFRGQRDVAELLRYRTGLYKKTVDQTVVSIKPAFVFNPLAFNCSPVLPYFYDQMAFFGKMIAAEQDTKRSKPLQLPPINNEAILKKFEKTLVGRVLNDEIPESRVKAMIAFLPSVWKCEGRAEGVKMGRGSFHFRFEEESTLQSILDNGPYHFDGWMIAINR